MERLNWRHGLIGVAAAGLIGAIVFPLFQAPYIDYVSGSHPWVAICIKQQRDRSKTWPRDEGELTIWHQEAARAFAFRIESASQEEAVYQITSRGIVQLWQVPAKGKAEKIRTDR